MPSAQARRLRPEATFLEPGLRRLHARCPRRSSRSSRPSRSVVEAASIDEAYLDLTGSLRMFGSPAEIGEHVRAVVADEQQITCSVGIGPTKFVAKIASRPAKPDGLVEVPPDGVADFLHPLPVEAMWGVGPADRPRSCNRLGHLHRRRPRPHPARRAAARPSARTPAPDCIELAWGRDGRRVVPSEPERSVGSQETFGARHRRPGGGPARAAADGRPDGQPDAQGRVASGRTVTLSVRFADFSELTRSGDAVDRRPTSPTRSTPRPSRLYERLGLDRARIRRVGVRVEGLVAADRAYRQPRLTDPERGWREAEQAVDAAVGPVRPGRGAAGRADPPGLSRAGVSRAVRRPGRVNAAHPVDNESRLFQPAGFISPYVRLD